MYSAPFLPLVSSAKTRNRFQPWPSPMRMDSHLTAKLSRKESATLPRLIVRKARKPSYPRLRKDKMMQTEKIHLEVSKGMLGSIADDHRSKTSRLTAVKLSTAYTAIDRINWNHR